MKHAKDFTKTEKQQIVHMARGFSYPLVARHFDTSVSVVGRIVRKSGARQGPLLDPRFEIPPVPCNNGVFIMGADDDDQAMDTLNEIFGGKTK